MSPSALNCDVPSPFPLPIPNGFCVALDINSAYEGTLAGSPLRRLVVDFWARNASENWPCDGVHSGFLDDLVSELLTNREATFHLQPADGKLSRCSCHHHGDEQAYYTKHEYTWNLSE